VGAPSRRHNLPLARTSFVGRERERLEVKRLLAMTRLLTLTGVGGCGKTRLGLEVASDLVGAYPDGVWLVELAPLSDPTLIAQAVAQALSVREQPGRALLQTLEDTLRTKKMLLVLDNCEHLMEAVVRLVDALLDLCPGLRILATYRRTMQPCAPENTTRRSSSPLSPSGLVSRGFGVRVPMHYLPGALLWAKDYRGPRDPRGDFLASADLGLTPLYLHYVGELGSRVFH
jgi:AAA domain